MRDERRWSTGTLLAIWRLTRGARWHNARVAALCLTCRHVIDDGEACAPGHEVTTDAARASAHVWAGPPAPRRWLPSVDRDVLWSVSWPSGIIALTLAGMTACSSLCTGDPGKSIAEPGTWLLAAVMWLGLSIAVGWEQKSGTLIRWPRWRRVADPRGVELPPNEGEPAARGVVQAAEAELAAPLSGRRCVAWDVRLERERRLFAHRAQSVAFTLREASGALVEIPAGAHVVERAHARAPRRAARRWLGGLFPGWPQRGRLAPVPFDEAREATLAPGDEIEVLGTLESLPAPGAPDPGYREAPAVVRAARGAVVLRKTAP